MLRQPELSKFDARGIEGVLLDSNKHGVYTVLVDGEDSPFRIVRSRHVTFDENTFPGAGGLEEAWDDEDASDSSVDSSEFEVEEEEDDDDVDGTPRGYRDISDLVEIDTSDANCLSDPSPSASNTASSGGAAAMSSSVPHEAPKHGPSSDSSEESSGFTSSDSEDPSAYESPVEQLPLTPSPDTNPPPAPERRYPSRTRKPPQDWWANMASSGPNPPAKILTGTSLLVSTSDEPTLREAMSTPPEERSLWMQAIEDELDSLHAKHTWTPDNSPGSKPLPTHVVLKVKRNADGSVDRFKARIVAGGNFQQYGTDYFDTYAPVVDFAMVRAFLYMALVHNMCIGQADVKTAFLNGKLEEDVWVVSPRGIPGHPPARYKLHKALYGLKQAHLAWHSKLVGDLNTLGFFELPRAPCVFMRPAADGSTGRHACFILVYVDDLLAAAPSQRDLSSIMESLQAMYEMRVMDSVDMFLGVQLNWSSDMRRLHLCQSHYVSDMVKKYGLADSKPASTPMVASFFSNLKAEKDKSVVDATQYRSMIGSLLFLAGRSRPDISAAVGILSRFNESPTRYCLEAAKRLLRYVRHTKNLGVTMQVKDPFDTSIKTESESRVNCFVDSDYAEDISDRKSTSGFIVKLGNAPCIWGSKKQIAVTLSTCEAEYHAMTIAVKEVIWLQGVMTESGFKVGYRPLLRSDNQSAIAWATGEKSPMTRAKHVDVRVHFIRDQVTKGNVDVEYVETSQNDADMLTKPLGPIQLGDAIARIGLEPI